MNVPFFFKQWGGVHKKRKGRKLDNKYWDEMPIVKERRVLKKSMIE
jgi:protein gp37